MIATLNAAKALEAAEWLRANETMLTVETVMAVVLVGLFAFFWHSFATSVALWFTDREAYRKQRRLNREVWDDRDGW